MAAPSQATLSSVTVPQGAGLLQRWRNDWVTFGREALGVRFTRMQVKAVRSFQANAKGRGGTGQALIKSGHGVGKTWFAAFAAIAFVSLYKNARVLLMSSSGPQLKTRLWAELKNIYRAARMRIGGELLETMLRIERILPSGAVDSRMVQPCSPENADNFQGAHAENILIIFDEAQAIPLEFWHAKDGMMGSGNAMFLGLFNPLYTSGPAHDEYHKPHEYLTLTFNCLEHENVVTGVNHFPGAVTRKWVEDRRETWGEDSVLFQVRVLGNFPTTTENTLLSLADLEACSELTMDEIGVNDGTWLGQDCARYGSDFNYLVVVRNHRLIHMAWWAGLDLMKTTGRVVRAVEDYDIPHTQVNVDGNGLGGGVVDRLRELGIAANDVQFGGSPLGDLEEYTRGERFVNRKAELHWAVREMVRARRLAVPKKFGQVWADLCAPRYDFDSQGRIRVESKDSLKKRIGRSPDAGDALVVAMARDLNSQPSVTFA